MNSKDKTGKHSMKIQYLVSVTVTWNLNERKRTMAFIAFRRVGSALAGVAQWFECWPAKQEVASLIPRQGTCLGCRPGPQLEACERQPHIDRSPSMSLRE